MTSIIVDTGPLYAIFDDGDKHHRSATRFLRSVDTKLYTNSVIVGEVAFLLSRAPHKRLEFLEWIGLVAGIDDDLPGDLPRIVEILRKYNDLRPDFADASLVALAERLGTRRIATFDSDFEVYRTLSNEKFENAISRR